MKIVNKTCPHCGGEIIIKGKSAKCPFCERTFLLEDIDSNLIEEENKIETPKHYLNKEQYLLLARKFKIAFLITIIIGACVQIAGIVLLITAASWIIGGIMVGWGSAVILILLLVFGLNNSKFRKLAEEAIN